MGLAQSGKLNEKISVLSCKPTDRILAEHSGKLGEMRLAEPSGELDERKLTTPFSDTSKETRFLELVEEIQEYIYMHCSADDLKSLSLTSSEYNKATRRYLLHTVNASTQLAHDEVELLNRLDDLVETVVLRIHSHPHRYYRSATIANCYASYFSRIPDGVLQRISRLHQLQELDLSDRVGHGGSLINDRAMEILCGGLISLKTLILCGSMVTSTGCSYLTSLSKLTKLDVSNCRQIGIEGVFFISNIGTLISLTIDDITNRELSHIVNMSQLEALNISLFPFIVDSAGLGISKLKKLKTLHLRGSTVTDNDMAQIKQLTELRAFSCRLTGITDKGFLNLSCLPKLRTLKFRDNALITDKGFLGVCLSEKLTHIDISGCVNISKSAIQVVRDSNPNVEILR